MGKRYPDDPRSSSNICHAAAMRMVFEPLQGSIHKQFRLRAGNQHLRGHMKGQTIEFTSACQVGQGHSLDELVEHGIQVPFLLIG